MKEINILLIKQDIHIMSIQEISVFLENGIYNLKMDIQRGIKNNMIMSDTLTAPSPISSFEASINYSGSYTSTINSNSDPNIRKLYGSLEYQKLVN